jgi:hypothetical protein
MIPKLKDKKTAAHEERPGDSGSSLIRKMRDGGDRRHVLRVERFSDGGTVDLAAAFAGLAELLAEAVVHEVDSGIHIVVLFIGNEVHVLASELDIHTGGAAFHGEGGEELGFFVIDHALDLLEALKGIVLQGIGRGKIAENDFYLHKLILPRENRDAGRARVMGRVERKREGFLLLKIT